MNQRRPIILSCSKDGLLIDCLFTYNRRACRPPKKETAKREPLCDVIERGIRDNWSGRYAIDLQLGAALAAFCRQAGTANPFEGADFLPVEVQIKRFGEGALVPALLTFKQFITRKRSPARIYVRHSAILPSHAASPLHRRIWGVFKTGQLESIGFNWSPSHPGYITITSNTAPSRLPQVAAHEAGHLFGLGDAYAAWYRFFAAAPNTQGYMMRDTSRVQPAEIAMLLMAHTTGRMQYFPRVFHLRNIARGLYRTFILSIVKPFRKHTG
ncbi:MAG TPA: hypothetical protein PK646_06300 [Bacillota bacterium]|jgi:hypothetical protein|nr:hypothetical protein [Fastidiosipila sp.]HPX93164.1 hypothetical protein [Bacillota bacterium]HQB81680.1 hypothetical protein [Bacillota bacterium]